MFSKLIQLLKTMLQFANMNNKFGSNSRNNGPNKLVIQSPCKTLLLHIESFMHIEVLTIFWYALFARCWPIIFKTWQ